MWLMYPIGSADIRLARYGILCLILASAVWYGAFAAVLSGDAWSAQVLSKVRNKFADLGVVETNWTPILILLVAYGSAGWLRILGYRLSRNVTGAIAQPDATSLGTVGAFLWLGAALTIYLGFSGLIGFVAVLGSFVELRFLRYPNQLFGLVLSPRAQTWVARYFWLRVAWLSVVMAASLVMLVSHGVIDLPRHPGGPLEASIVPLIDTLRRVFNGLAGTALVLLPVVAAGYWLILFAAMNALPRLLDPSGPVPQPEPPLKPGFDQLKAVLRPQEW